MSEHEILMDEPVFPNEEMKNLIDSTITEMVMKKYGKVWKKRYQSNEIIHEFHHAGTIQIEPSYMNEIHRNVVNKIIKYQNNGKPYNLRRVVKRAIRYEAS